MLQIVTIMFKFVLFAFVIWGVYSASTDADFVIPKLPKTTDRRILILGAEPFESERFQRFAAGSSIFFLNSDYDQDTSHYDAKQEKFVEETTRRYFAHQGSNHILIDFNNLEQLSALAKKSTSYFDVVCFDYGVIGYTQFSKSHWDCLTQMLRTGGILCFDMFLTYCASHEERNNAIDCNVVAKSESERFRQLYFEEAEGFSPFAGVAFDLKLACSEKDCDSIIRTFEKLCREWWTADVQLYFGEDFNVDSNIGYPFDVNISEADKSFLAIATKLV